MKTLLLLIMMFGTAGAAAIAQGNAPSDPMASMPMRHPMDGHRSGGMMARGPGQPGAVPTEPGQAAFGTIQQIVEMLRADPRTDWSKVDIDALRQHLVDMDEVTLRAAAHKQPIENGLRIEVTGNGRTLEAIQRMLPMHARDIDGLDGWTARSAGIADGVELTVTSGDAAEVAKIRALGFMGIMVAGSHHQMHHLAMAKGEMNHGD